MSARAAGPGLPGLSGDSGPYLTIQETAVRLRCSTKTVRRYVASGKLVAYRVGPTMLRIRVTELDAMVASGAVPNARTA
ncbi:MAG: helix-turn-helix domain-containing protein [Mycobacteriales bacterium]